jgi:hypothetical protein
MAAQRGSDGAGAAVFGALGGAVTRTDLDRSGAAFAPALVIEGPQNIPYQDAITTASAAPLQAWQS